MKRNEILSIFRSLSMSQGAYGRLLARLEEVEETDPDMYDQFMCDLEAQNFKDAVDLILYIEG